MVKPSGAQMCYKTFWAPILSYFEVNSILYMGKVTSRLVHIQFLRYPWIEAIRAYDMHSSAKHMNSV